MLDYRYLGRGAPIYVADMTDDEIASCLADGVQITDSYHSTNPKSDVLKRLKLEQEIRAMGLRK